MFGFRTLFQMDSHSKEDCLKYWAVEDETWMLYFSQRTKQENRTLQARGDQRLTVVRSTLTNRKNMLLVALTSDGKVHIE